MGSIYSSYDYTDRKKKLVEWVLSVSFMMFYPMLVSMYPTSSNQLD